MIVARVQMSRPKRQWRKRNSRWRYIGLLLTLSDNKITNNTMAKMMTFWGRLVLTSQHKRK